jgi:DNA invertase Pin-like site-specific DNA recombinase
MSRSIAQHPPGSLMPENGHDFGSFGPRYEHSPNGRDNGQISPGEPSGHVVWNGTGAGSRSKSVRAAGEGGPASRFGEQRAEHQPQESGRVRVVGYTRVSTQEQSDSGAGLQVQRSAIELEAERRGWELVRMYEDAGASRKDLKRPGLQEALALVESRAADVLCVSKLDRLSRSVHDFSGLLQRSQRRGWSLCVLDLQLDTSSPSGALVANVMAMSEWERRVIGARTRDALAVKREQGVRLGRPREIPPAVVERIQLLHRSGYRVAEITRKLNEDGTRTPRGCPWYPNAVARTLARQIAA